MSRYCTATIRFAEHAGVALQTVKLVDNTELRRSRFLFVGVLYVKYDLMQLPFGELEFALVCIFFIHGHAFITAYIERFVTGIGPIDSRGDLHLTHLFVVDEEFDGGGAVELCLFHGVL